MNPKFNFLILSLWLLYLSSATVSSQVNVDVNLNIKHSVDGVSDFGRDRHIYVHTGATDPEWNGHEDMRSYLVNDLDAYFGRDNGSAGWKCRQVLEDPNKPHWPDVNDMITKGDGLKDWYESDDFADDRPFENKGRMVMGMNPYPIYPSLDWGNDGKMDSGWQTYDVDAAAFFTAHYLDKYYAKSSSEKGEPLPYYWEVMNEPDMAIMKPFVMFMSSPEKLFEFHNLSAQQIRSVLGNKAPKIGGFTWGQHDFWAADWINRVNAEDAYYNYSDPGIFPVYDNMWLAGNPTSMRNQGSPLWSKRGEDWWQWDALYQKFIDECGANMDFYAVHIYDWPDKDNGGTIRSGDHTEAMLDMMEWYDIYKFNNRKEIVISEYGSVHGAYITGLGYKRRDWENLRPFNQMFMQFLERPSHIRQTMPFAPVKGTWGDWWNADGSLAQRYEVTMMDPIGNYTSPGLEHPDWEWSDIIKWYELWKDVKGTRIDTKSDDLDIQVDAYVNGKHVYLILNNLEINPHTINLNLFDDYSNPVVNAKITHQYLHTGQNRPVNEVTNLSSAPGQVTLDMSATMIIDYTFANNVTINQESKEYKYMSNALTSAKNTYGSQLCHVKSAIGNEFTAYVNNVNVPAIGEATLRIGMKAIRHDYAKITINGHTLINQAHNDPEIDTRGRGLSRGGHGWWGVLEIDVPVNYLQRNNTIKCTFNLSDVEYTSFQIQTWDFTKAPGRSGNGDIPVTGVSVSPTSLSLKVGQTGQLTGSVIPANATNKSVTFTSRNTSTASVTQSGVVTAKAVGTTYVDVKSVDGGYIATATINVTDNDNDDPIGDVFVLGNTNENRVTNDGWNSNMIVNKTDVYTNNSGAAQQVQIDKFNFYASRKTDPVTPFVVKVNGNNNFTVLAVGTTRSSSTYNVGANTFAFNDGTSKVINLANGETIATGFLDANANGTGGGSGSVIPFNQNAPADQLWYTGGGDGNSSGSVTEGSAPTQGSSTLDLARNYSYSIEFSKGENQTNIAPTVSFAQPANGQSFTEPASVYVKVNASDADGSISNVQLYLNGTLVRQEDGSPYEWNASNQNDPALKSMAAGTYTLKAIATDNGGKTNSATVTITVDGDNPPDCDLPFTSSGTTITKQTKTWSTGVIDISCASNVDVTMQAKGEGPMETSDYLNIYYKLDGGSQVAMLQRTNAFATQTVSADNLSGNSIEIIVEGKTSWQDETYTVSGISITKDGSVTLPGDVITIEAESFVNTSGTLDDSQWGGPGLGANKTATTIDWVNDGDYMDYTVDIPEDGSYEIVYYITSPNTGSTISFGIPGTVFNTTTVPNNGSWSNFEALKASQNANFSAGTHVVRLTAGAQTWTWNLDKFTLQRVGTMVKTAKEDISGGLTEVVLYPNPVRDVLNLVVKGELHEGASLIIYNSTGAQVHSAPVLHNEVQLQCNELTSGIYILRVINGTEVISIRFSKINY